MIRTIAACLLLVLFQMPAGADDEGNEGVAFVCDPDTGTFRLQHVIDAGAPLESEPIKRSCSLKGYSIETQYFLHKPSARGQCGYAPGAQIESLRINGALVLSQTALNRCFFSRLEMVTIETRPKARITFCGSRFKDGVGERPGCFSDTMDDVMKRIGAEAVYRLFPYDRLK